MRSGGHSAIQAMGGMLGNTWGKISGNNLVKKNYTRLKKHCFPLKKKIHRVGEWWEGDIYIKSAQGSRFMCHTILLPARQLCPQTPNIQMINLIQTHRFPNCVEPGWRPQCDCLSWCRSSSSYSISLRQLCDLSVSGFSYLLYFIRLQ